MDDQRVLWEEREGVVVEVGDAEEEVDQGQCLEMVEMVEGGDLGLGKLLCNKKCGRFFVPQIKD